VASVTASCDVVKEPFRQRQLVGLPPSLRREGGERKRDRKKERELELDWGYRGEKEGGKHRKREREREGGYERERRGQR
jgi:hypothetical protein